MKPRGHFRIERRHHLRQRFHDGDAQTAVLQLLGHFQTDVAATHHDRAASLAILDPGHDPLHVRNVADGEMARTVNAEDRWPERRRAGGKHE